MEVGFVKMELIAKLKDLLLDRDMLESLKSKTDTSVNIFDVLKIADTEIRHSNMLVWLFDPNANHGLGSEILKRLINWFVAEYIASSNEAVELLMCNYFSFSVRREWHNIDLLLISSEAKAIIAIENKIFSGEHSDQLANYKSTVEEHFLGYKHYFLYLTLDGDESSDSSVWHSLGYENIIDWVEASLTPAIRPDTKQLIEQYVAVLRRMVMGYPQEVIDLCNKIYQKHREAIDLIQEITNSGRSGYSDFESWYQEWEASKHITQPYIQGNYLVFRTPGLDEIFPINGNPKWSCYYMILRLPFPNRLTIEFASAGLNKRNNDKFLKIKAQYNPRELKDNWQWHRVKTWKLHDYDPDQTEEFSSVADALKLELERMIFDEIPKFEAVMRNLIK